jgi:predicted DNA-binding protein (UPF0251 family)
MLRTLMMELKNFSKYCVKITNLEVLEIMITKITELEAIKLLKYDDMYTSYKGDKL